MIHRTFLLAAALGATTVVANAGQVQIGDTTTSPGSNKGLTLSYVGAANLGSFSEKSYDYRLYAGATTTIPAPYNTGSYVEYGGQTPATIKDSTNYTGVGGPNGVTFSLISDICNAHAACPGGSNLANASENFYGTIGTSAITIPVGVFGVTDVFTMLQDYTGAPSTINPVNGQFAPSSNTSVTFNFGTTAIGGITKIVTVALNNALASAGGGIFYGQIRSGLDCSSVTASLCSSYAKGDLAPSSSLATVVNGIAGPNVTVVTNNLSNVAYTGAQGGQYGGSAGLARLDDQGFLFGSAYSNLFLVNVQVSDNSGAVGISQTALSAITVDTVVVGASTPEPASILMLGGGALALVGLARRRRVAKS